MANSWVCVDANLVVKLVVEEAYSSETRTLWRGWQNEGREVVAPSLLRFEVTSVLRKHVVRGLRTAAESRQALELALAFEIQYIEPANFHLQAFELADRLGRPAAYDAHYLAVAEYLACDLWTADERLVNAVRSMLPWVKWVGG
ncbi:MAG: type II toxin-antitoxin system VapC family toxin [Anaerolineae bacterium]|nr:type II toxin-antitoxin system VapC family toxin [Anaerolineae bacterium]